LQIPTTSAMWTPDKGVLKKKKGLRKEALSSLRRASDRALLARQFSEATPSGTEKRSHQTQTSLYCETSMLAGTL